MPYAEHHGKRHKRRRQDNHAAEKEYDGWRDGKPKREKFAVVFLYYPAEAVYGKQNSVYGQIDDQRVGEPETEAGVRDIEYHKRETAVSADLFDYFEISYVYSVFVSGFVGYRNNNVRHRNDCHYYQSVVIEPAHKFLFSKILGG